VDGRSSEPFDIGRLIGAAIKRTRLECHWTQADLADRLHSTQSQISRLESGTRRHIDGPLASRAIALLGIRVDFDAQTLGMAGRREQRDLVHATCSAYVARRLAPGGWETRLEVEIGTGRYRGWIDVLGFRPADRSLLIGEVKTEILDLGAIQRTLAWYEREAWKAARLLGWNAQRSTAVLLVLATAENDARVSVNRAGLKASFPTKARQLQQWVDSPGSTAPPPAIAMINPRTRRFEWLMSTRSDGRRSDAPFADYRDAARKLRRG